MSELSDLKISMHYCVIKLVVTGLVWTVHEGVRSRCIRSRPYNAAECCSRLGTASVEIGTASVVTVKRVLKRVPFEIRDARRAET